MTIKFTTEQWEVRKDLFELVLPAKKTLDSKPIIQVYGHNISAENNKPLEKSYYLLVPQNINVSEAMEDDENILLTIYYKEPINGHVVIK